MRWALFSENWSVTKLNDLTAALLAVQCYTAQFSIPFGSRLFNLKYNRPFWWNLCSISKDHHLASLEHSCLPHLHIYRLNLGFLGLKIFCLGFSKLEWFWCASFWGDLSLKAHWKVVMSWQLDTRLFFKFLSLGRVCLTRNTKILAI